MAFAQSGKNFPIKINGKRVDTPWHVCHGVFLRAENNLRDAIHEARARAYHTQTSEGDQHDLTADDGSLHHGCCGLHCGHGGWSHHSADR